MAELKLIAGRIGSVFDIENRKWLDRNRGVGLDEFSMAMQKAAKAQEVKSKPKDEASENCDK